MNVFIYFVFFLSGSAALIFEFVWFRLIELILGNSIWSASIVLASFMGGLALGNALAARYIPHLKKIVRFYILLEVIIGVSGIGLVLFLPYLTSVLVPFVQLIINHAHSVNLLRFITAFGLMLLPTTAMGMTLPVLVKILQQDFRVWRSASLQSPVLAQRTDQYASLRSSTAPRISSKRESPVQPKILHFGKNLGLLYGFNTLGAVVGVLSTEIFLVRFFGLTTTGIIAGCLNLTAAGLVVLINLKKEVFEETHIPENEIQSTKQEFFNNDVFRLLLVGFLTGMIFLALEVIWFRFLMLFNSPYSLYFACILAVVLFSISLGGLLAAGCLWIKNYLGLIIGINGPLVLFLYKHFDLFINLQWPKVNVLLAETIFLVAPIGLISGMTFTLLGQKLCDETKESVKSSGWLGLSNTLGSMVGSLVGGFLMIPYFGIECSFIVLAILYVVSAWLLPGNGTLTENRRSKFILGIPTLWLLVSLIFFPSRMMTKYLDFPVAYFFSSGEERVAVHEGINETIQYMEKKILNYPYYYRLMTNGHSMAANNFEGRRYMSLFVYLPGSLHPSIKKAALICFGTGTTAKALTRLPEIEQIDIADISKDVLDMSAVVYPIWKDNPLSDHRVKVHIEDGRFFLLTSKEQYDLITAEPPPPNARAVVNLYTKEYFSLVYNRLSQGGMVSYWLPVSQLSIMESKSILKSFCERFEHCSLWLGSKGDWIMLGVKTKLDFNEETLMNLWQRPGTKEDLLLLGISSPEYMGSFFIADRQRIQPWTADSLDLTDNFPLRLSNYPKVTDKDLQIYHDFVMSPETANHFIYSTDFSWPKNLQEKTNSFFPLFHLSIMNSPKNSIELVQQVHEILSDPLSPADLINWPLDNDEIIGKIAERILEDNKPFSNAYDLVSMKIKQAQQEKNLKAEFDWDQLAKHLAVKSIHERDFLSAERYYSLMPKNDDAFYFLRIYCLYRSGQQSGAEALKNEYLNEIKSSTESKNQEMSDFWKWLSDIFTVQEII